MSEKRRGLGRGLGALIPTMASGDRPVDVFFPNEPAAPREGASLGAKDALVPTSSDTPHGASDVKDDAAQESAARSETASESAEATSDGGTSSATATANRPGSSAGSPPDASRGRSRGSVTRAAAMATALKPVANRGADNPVFTVSAPPGVREISSVSRETYAAAVGDSNPTDLVPVPGASFAEIPIDSIRPNSRQPRTVFDENDLAELVGSIREIGVLQPIVVRPEPDGSGYELIMGERRWRATREAGLSVIPAIIRETDDADLLRDALLENLHRSALNPLEEAAAYRQLLDDFGCTHEELASRISRSRPQISNTLRLLRLPPLVQRRVAAGVLSAGHARALLGLSDGSEIERLAQRIVAEGLSVRATEEVVSLGARADDEKPVVRRPRRGGRVQAIDELAGRLSDRFETRVKVDLGKTKGKLTVEFASVEDLNRILTVMAPEEQGLFKTP